MDKEQNKRMAYRSVIQSDEGQGDIEYTVKVSGDLVELHQVYEPEEIEGQHEIWSMSKETLKNFIAAAQWCVEKSEAFEAAHPIHPTENET